tara:strand:+ start:480 stop:1676 length:1197 start_codon:yes stop_codon:yes gene_type:complete
MATNRDLLTEAIADAKAVKHMAIANAKSALEEAFTPRLKEMLSAKIQEMDEDSMYETEETLDEVGSIEPEKTDEMDLEELLAELEEEENSEELNEAEDEDESEMDDEESEEEEGEPLDLEDMTDEDLKKMIEDVIADMVASGDLEGGDVDSEDEEGEEIEVSDEEEEEVDLAELLKEIEEEMDETNEEMIDEAGVVSPEVIDFLTGIPWMALPFLVFGGGAAAAAIPGYRKWKQENAEKAAKAEKMVPKISPAQKSELAKLSAERTSAGDSTAEKDELMEARKTIKSLKSKINEAVKTTNSTNLLNAKLLYTNKIFKAKNLNESQKVKVLSSFDKANTTKEAKLVYETLSEGLKVKKSTIRENLGRASKTTTIPTTKKPIMESNDVFARMQKLAGIIK